MSLEVAPVQDKPLALLITLPNGCTPGGWEAAKAFAKTMEELRAYSPDKQFQLLPFSYKMVGQHSALDAIMAVEC